MGETRAVSIPISSVDDPSQNRSWPSPTEQPKLQLSLTQPPGYSATPQSEASAESALPNTVSPDGWLNWSNHGSPAAVASHSRNPVHQPPVHHVWFIWAKASATGRRRWSF